jgi:hypothetical protein
MARTDQDDDLQYQAELDKLTREKALMILEAVKGGQPLNTADMIENIDPYLGDSQALAELLQRTARGENALLDLMQRMALELGGKQAEADLAERARRNCQPTLTERAHRVLDRMSIAA